MFLFSPFSVSRYTIPYVPGYPSLRLEATPDLEADCIIIGWVVGESSGKLRIYMRDGKPARRGPSLGQGRHVNSAGWSGGGGSCQADSTARVSSGRRYVIDARSISGAAMGRVNLGSHTSPRALVHYDYIGKVAGRWYGAAGRPSTAHMKKKNTESSAIAWPLEVVWLQKLIVGSVMVGELRQGESRDQNRLS